METPTSPEKQRFRLGNFEGPLDLLLFLIRKSEINIYDIPIAEITEQYLKYIEYATGVNLDTITEFYVMAASLLHIKSQMLLPIEVDFGDEGRDPREELVEQLIEYQKYRKISDLMADKGRDSEWVVERQKKQRILPFIEEDDLWDKIEIWDLLKTFSNIITSISSERIIDLYEEVTVNEKTTLLYELMERQGQFSFADLIVRGGSPIEFVCAFLAILEAAKTRRIVVYQNRMFGDIRISAREQVSVAESES